MAIILVVEDDVALNHLLRLHLEAEGHVVRQLFTGDGVLAALAQETVDLLILDWMLPGMDGLAICRQVRQAYLLPILMVTARSEEIDQVLGLEVGADDYLTKPFSLRQMVARVHAILRRVRLEQQRGRDAAIAAPSVNTNIVRVGPLVIDLTQRAAYLADQEIELTRKEYDLLVLLASHPGWVFKREIILQEVWGGDYEGFDRTIDNHITKLRRKLGVVGERIETVWGVGYRLQREH